MAHDDCQFEDTLIKTNNGYKEIKDIKKGDLVLTKNKLLFKTYDEKNNLNFDIHNIKYYVDCINQYLKFNYKDKIYKIVFNNKNISRYIYFLKLLYK